MAWGSATWSGGNPGNDFLDVSTTTVNFVDLTADNSATDFGGLPSYSATNGTTFNGTDGLLLQAPISEFLNEVNSINYKITFNTAVTGLSFRIVDIDKRAVADANGDPFTDRITVSFFNGGVPVAISLGSDYTFGTAVTEEVSGSVFIGNSLVGNITTSEADVIFTLGGKLVDEVVINFENDSESGATALSEGSTAILVSDMTWNCSIRDIDNDSNPDFVDNDSDGDGCPDALEGDGGFTLGDLDGDDSLGDTVDANGIPTIAGTGQNDLSSADASVTGGECDDDGDTLTNDAEAGLGTDPLNADTDGDGIDDGTEVGNTDDPLDPCDPAQSAGYAGYDAANAIWAAADCDSDSFTNGAEDTAGSDPYDASSTPATDTDGDGVPDVSDASPADPCLPVQSAGYSAYVPGNATWAAADCDSDGATNGDEDTAGSDPYDPASTPTTDTDGDGVPDVSDAAPNDPCDPVQSGGYTGYDAGNAIWAAADCDGDLVFNGDEDTAGSDPYDPNSTPATDTDGDGVPDVSDSAPSDPCDPVQSAGYTGYDGGNATWAAADCDGDGAVNGAEDTAGSDPYDASSTPSADTDGDGVPDVSDSAPADPCLPAQSAGYTGYVAVNATWAAADCDGDGVTNGDEASNGTDPYAVSGDTDGDGIDDDNEINDGTGLNNPCDPAQSAGYTGYDAGNSIWAGADCDGDGITNGDELPLGNDPYLADTDADSDGDGVPNTIDLCPGTPAGSVVDIDGCAIFSLPSDNFDITLTGESCIANNDGSVTVTAATALNYTATLSGSGGDTINDFTDTTSFTDLAAGDYTLCITVEGQPGYEICFDVTIVEPESLSVSSIVSSSKDELTLELRGGVNYTVDVNGMVYKTQDSQIKVPLNSIENVVSVRTDKDCQGIHEEVVFLNSEILVYQDPIALGEMTVLLGKQLSSSMDISMYNLSGVKVLDRQYKSIDDSELKLDVNSLPAGIYIINIRTDNSLVNYKIIKQ